MGFVLITESMSFVPAEYGIQNNMPVNVIVVGSGAGGSSSSNAWGGASGKAGKGYNYRSYDSGGGGGGGGFGGGGGGAGNVGGTSGRGGGAGAVKHKSMFFTDVTQAIAVTIGQPVAATKAGAAATNGEASSFGSYLTAAGGEVGGGGAGYSKNNYGTGGGGGQGGFQLGYFLYGCRGGSNNPTDTVHNEMYVNGRGTSGAAGGGGISGSGSDSVKAAGIGGNGGGGNGSATEFLSAQDGYNHFGEPGQGCVLIFW